MTANCNHTLVAIVLELSKKTGLEKMSYGDAVYQSFLLSPYQSINELARPARIVFDIWISLNQLIMLCGGVIFYVANLQKVFGRILKIMFYLLIFQLLNSKATGFDINFNQTLLAMFLPAFLLNSIRFYNN